MGRLYLPAQFFDGNGDPLAGGKVYTFDAAATTTPKTTYTTNALSVAHANPIVLDSEGRIADVFAATGEGFFIELTDAADDPVAEFENVEALGESSTDNITRTFTASRYKVSSGEVETGNDGTLVEYGSSSPVNTGGYVKESGWAETQGTKKIIDFAAVEMTGTLDVTGAVDVGGAMTVGGALSSGGLITEAGKDLAGVVQTDATTFSGVSALEISLPASPAGVTGWDVYVWDLIQSATSTLDATFSFDDGSTYKTGASDYAFASSASNSTGILNARDDANASIRVLPSSETATTRKGVLRMGVQTASNGDPSMIFGDWFGQHLNGGVNYGGWATFSGTYVGGSVSSPLTRVKLAPSSGTISGKYMIVPKRGTGN